MRRPWAGLLRRRREPEAAVDPRAEELRRKLDESGDVSEPEATPEDPEARRRAVHESARTTVEQMRKR